MSRQELTRVVCGCVRWYVEKDARLLCSLDVIEHWADGTARIQDVWNAEQFAALTPIPTIERLAAQGRFWGDDR